MSESLPDVSLGKGSEWNEGTAGEKRDRKNSMSVRDGIRIQVRDSLDSSSSPSFIPAAHSLGRDPLPLPKKQTQASFPQSDSKLMG